MIDVEVFGYKFKYTEGHRGKGSHDVMRQWGKSLTGYSGLSKDRYLGKWPK